MHSLKFEIPPCAETIQFDDSIFLMGSCFSEHISERLNKSRFEVFNNPNGLLFNPISIVKSLNSYLQPQLYTTENLFELNELWNSWDHHSSFSHINKSEALEQINTAQIEASMGIQKTNWLIITLGSAFQYFLKDNNLPVANNHRAPAQWFEKKLLETDFIENEFIQCFNKLKKVNPDIKIIFTISPVRHIREGVIENNRSKARLIEVVHRLCENRNHVYYFPAYELVIDVLRDYRYYDIDYVHPNYLATQFVWDQFLNTYMDSKTQELVQEISEVVTASNHRPRFNMTQAHQQFSEKYYQKTKNLALRFPSRNWEALINHFYQGMYYNNQGVE